MEFAWLESKPVADFGVAPRLKPKQSRLARELYLRIRLARIQAGLRPRLGSLPEYGTFRLARNTSDYLYYL